VNEEQLRAMRHSLAHIMAAAVQRLWPEAKFGVGPVVESGFYYDIDLGDVKISDQQFGKIEKTMRRPVRAAETALSPTLEAAELRAPETLSPAELRAPETLAPAALAPVWTALTTFFTWFLAALVLPLRASESF
jgi:hypothetical protein